MKSLELDALTRPRRDPIKSRMIRRLAKVFIEIGRYSKTESYRRTVALLRAWDPRAFSDLTLEHVRLRCERSSKADDPAPEITPGQ